MARKTELLPGTLPTNTPCAAGEDSLTEHRALTRVSQIRILLINNVGRTEGEARSVCHTVPLESGSMPIMKLHPLGSSPKSSVNFIEQQQRLVKCPDKAAETRRNYRMWNDVCTTDYWIIRGQNLHPHPSTTTRLDFFPLLWERKRDRKTTGSFCKYCAHNGWHWDRSVAQSSSPTWVVGTQLPES